MKIKYGIDKELERLTSELLGAKSIAELEDKKSKHKHYWHSPYFKPTEKREYLRSKTDTIYNDDKVYNY